MKKIHGDIIFSKLCITNDDQLIYGYWDMENNRIFCNIGPIFALLPNIKLKNQNFEKMKNTLEISLFYTSAPEIMIICYTVSEIWRVADVICIFHFGLYFAILPAQKPNWKKKEKLPGDILILHMRTKNYDHMIYNSWNMVQNG